MDEAEAFLITNVLTSVIDTVRALGLALSLVRWLEDRDNEWPRRLVCRLLADTVAVTWIGYDDGRWLEPRSRELSRATAMDRVHEGRDGRKAAD